MLIQGFLQHRQDSVRAYANDLETHWGHVGWNEPKDREVLYYNTFAAICDCVENPVTLITPTCSIFDTLDVFFIQALASKVTHVKHENPMQQQLQHQQQQKQPRNSFSYSNKHCSWPSLTEPVDSGSGKSSQS
jgi:peptide methionine sulfoxide reductase MsrB